MKIYRVLIYFGLAWCIFSCSDKLVSSYKSPSGYEREKLNIKRLVKTESYRAITTTKEYSFLQWAEVYSSKSPNMNSTVSIAFFKKEGFYEMRTTSVKSYRSLTCKVEEYTKFDKNGIMLQKGEECMAILQMGSRLPITVQNLRCIAEFPIKVWQSYDLNGSVVSEYDYEKGFSFSLDKVLQMIEYDERITLKSPPCEIRRTSTKDLKIWQQHYSVSNPPFRIISRNIDGQSGKIIKEFISQPANH